MLRKAKRWDESDRRMEDLEYRLRERLGTDIYEAELASLQAGGVPPSFDPGSLGDDERLPSVSSASPQSYSNPNTFDPMAQADPRQSFRDFERAEDMRRRSQGVPVEAQRERDFASGQYGDFDQRLHAQSRWAQSMQIDPEGRGFGPTDFQRRYNPKESREWYEQNVVPRIRERAQGELAAAEAKQQAERDTPHGSTNLYDAKLERADLERRVKTYARQKGLSYEQSLEALSATPGSPFNALKEPLPGDKYTLAERNSSHQHRMKNNSDRKAEMDLRRERLTTRGLYGLNQSQANAYVALGDPNLSDEQRLAAEYTLNPRKFMVDYATAGNKSGSSIDDLVKMQAMEINRRRAEMEENPVSSMWDMAERGEITDEVKKFLSKQALPFDTTWGIFDNFGKESKGGMSFADEARFREYLIKEKGFSEEAARNVARAAANARRRSFRQQSEAAPDEQAAQ